MENNSGMLTILLCILTTSFMNMKRNLFVYMNMEPSYFFLQISFLFLLLLQTLELSIQYHPPLNELRTFIIQTNDLFDRNTLQLNQDHVHISCLESEKPCVLHWYNLITNGFSARMTAGQAQELAKKHGIVSVRPEIVYSLQTTHTYEFLGLHWNIRRAGLWGSSGFYGEGVIIGVLDGGITSKHPSFDDDGMSPPPAKWKGECPYGITCNNKLIGGFDFLQDSGAGPTVNLSGHEFHTSSTAGGNFVRNASFFGQAKGTAAGIAPQAHLAMYRVCDSHDYCNENAVAAAVEMAIKDGVDVLSVSLSSKEKPDFYDDLFAIGSFSAVEQGIVVSSAAGNHGPDSGTVSNGAPWMLTVGASTVDRSFRAKVVLGNHEELDGEELIQPTNSPNNTILPLIFPGASGDRDAGMCLPGSLGKEVKGKIVICIGNSGEEEVKNAGGVAMIVVDITNNTQVEPNTLPGSRLDDIKSRKIIAYVKSTPNPTAKIIFQGTILGVKDAPAVPIFSSRGPNLRSPGILKPDIIGPGVNILGAWNSLEASARFSVQSGTSMACPHLGGVATLVKQSHPDWSPAAIKSAIMTSAQIHNLNSQPIVDESMLPASPFAVGAGHVNPIGANDPGLIYDIHPNDYITYLCGLNYTREQVMMIVSYSQVNCSGHNSITEAELNYPTFVVDLLVSGTNKGVHSRTVTNVGEASSTYKFIIEKSSDEVDILVSPSRLVFTKIYQKLTYSVTFRRSTNVTSSPYTEAAILWTDSKHRVRSRISIKLANQVIMSVASTKWISLISILQLVLVESILLKWI